MKNALIRFFRFFGLNLQRHSDPYKDILRLLELNSQYTVLDCGAYKGAKAQQVLKLWPAARVYCFEPQPEVFRHLEERFADEKRCTAVMKALSDQPGSMNLYVTSEQYTSSLLEPKEKEIHTEQVVAVDVTTIDQFVAESGITDVRLIKLDLQGNELKALEGARKTLLNCDAVLTEINFRERYQGCTAFHELYGFLVESGFTLYKLYDIHGYPNGAWMLGDALFIKHDLHH